MSRILNNYLSHIFVSYSGKEFPQIRNKLKNRYVCKKNMEKIHFLIFPKQNTFTKPRKLENCGNFTEKAGIL